MSEKFESPEFVEQCEQGHQLQGKVKYCPFCGVPIQQIKPDQILQNLDSTESSFVDMIQPEIVLDQIEIQSPVQLPDQLTESDSVSARSTEVPEDKLRTIELVTESLRTERTIPVRRQDSKLTKALIVTVFLAFIALISYEILITRDQNIAISPDAETESAIRMAVDEMKLTGQSLYKEKQMRKSLQNAKEALAISESYRETVNQLELANTNTLRKTKEHLTAYLAKVVWLSQHSNEFNEAIKSFSDPNNKDQFMFDLLKQHVISFNLKEEKSEDAWKLELEPVSIQLGL
jgi:hypothetical protein